VYCAIVYNKSATKQNGCQTWQPSLVLENGRDDWIRTSDLTHPKRARYQAAPRPVCSELYYNNSGFAIPTRFLLEYRQQLAQLGSQLLQALSLFRSARSHCARVGGCFGLE
jgi:hypothetical protein